MVAVQHERNSRDQILTAARRLFADHGFHQSSMAELATAAQVSVGQIYRQFKSKEDIIDAIVRSDADERLGHMEALHQRLRNGELDIDQTFEHLFLQSVEEKDEALSFDILAEGFRNETVSETIGTLCERLRHVLKNFACAANPDLSGEALDGAGEMMLACLFGLGHRSLSRPSLDAARTARRAAQMIVAGLRAVR